MTSSPEQKKNKNYYIWGGDLGFSYLKNGVEDYISVCGHTITDTIRRWVGEENRPKNPEVWVNKKGNVYMMDCGCGMYDRCKLSYLCLETKVASVSVDPISVYKARNPDLGTKNFK